MECPSNVYPRIKNLGITLQAKGRTFSKHIEDINTKKYHCPSQETEVTSTPTRPVDNVIGTKGLQDRNTNIIAGTTVENKGKLILTSKIEQLEQ